MDNKEAKIPVMAFVAAITGCILWGSALSVVKIALEEYDPIFLVFARMAIAFLVLTPIVFLKCRPIRIYSKRDAFLLVLLTLCDPVGFFTFEALALQYTSASQAGMMWALAPLLITMGGWLILGERTTRPVIMCFLIAMGGVMMLTAGGAANEHASNPLLGNFLEFLSLCGSAGFIIILRFLRGLYPAMLVVWLQSMGAAILFLPALFFDPTVLPTQFNLTPFLVLFYLGACVSFGAQACSAYAIARIPIPRMTALSNSIPVVGVLSGLVLLGESLSGIQWGACAVVLSAVAISQYYQRNETASCKESAAEKLAPNDELRKEERLLEDGNP